MKALPPSTPSDAFTSEVPAIERRLSREELAADASGEVGWTVVRPSPRQQSGMSNGESLADLQQVRFARLMGHESALQAIEGHLPSLIAERTELVAKEIGGNISARDARRLAMVRWQLEQYEMARLEPTLLKLEAQASVHERVAASVSALVEALTEAHPSAIRSRKKK